MAAVNPVWYIDDNKTIYYSDRNYITNMSLGSDQMTAGLADITSIPGQSTWIINRIRFGLYLNMDYDGSVSMPAYGSMLLGIVDRGNTQIFDYFDDYQDIRGWPLKGTHRTWYIQSIDSPELAPLNKAVISGTYSPRKTLVLNRMQDIMVNVDNVGSTDVEGSYWISIEARRGD